MIFSNNVNTMMKIFSLRVFVDMQKIPLRNVIGQTDTKKKQFYKVFKNFSVVVAQRQMHKNM